MSDPHDSNPGDLRRSPPLPYDSNAPSDSILEVRNAQAPADHSADYRADPGAVTQDGDFQPLCPRFVQLDRITSCIGMGILFVIAFSSTLPVAFAIQRDFQWTWPAAILLWLSLLVFCLYFGWFWPAIAYRHTSWSLREIGFEIRRGVLWKHRIAVPVARVQHVDVSQGPFQRMFDLGKLTIHTAGTRLYAVELDGLDHAQALRIRDELVKQKESLDVV